MSIDFKPTVYSDSLKDNPCPICYESLEEGDLVSRKLINEVEHVFHESCIKDWVKIVNSCPLCTKVVNKDSLLNRKERINVFITNHLVELGASAVIGITAISVALVTLFGDPGVGNHDQHIAVAHGGAPAALAELLGDLVERCMGN